MVTVTTLPPALLVCEKQIAMEVLVGCSRERGNPGFPSSALKACVFQVLGKVINNRDTCSVGSAGMFLSLESRVDGLRNAHADNCSGH
ncbi:hypothetical protein JTE90_026758 [Oedothorax gibbosus]|uniref:Secreted protein n=1 Tax=Oedothorax gibbosus TaxID=931172 RepID=A0AAV6UWS9_9ARAC|nr:hypothetical protein JTE90_026758 [Oedothorax gibbosus]